MIRFLASLLMSVMLLTPVSAQESVYKDVRAPVNVAANLYVGCVNAQGMSIHDEDVKTPNSIKVLVEYADDWCIAWTVIWYNALMGHSIDTWDETRLNRFTVIRAGVMQQYGDDLATLYNSRRK